MTGLDIGTQYRSVIFYTSNPQKITAENSVKTQQEKWETSIKTQIIKSSEFYRAEEYHQNYLNKNNLGSCSI